MTIYYVRETALGSGNGSSYENSMSAKSHNEDRTFVGGDVIYLCDKISAKLAIPSSGDEGNEIIYRGDYAGHHALLRITTSSGMLRGEYKSNIIVDSVECFKGKIGIAFINGNHNITIKRCTVHEMLGNGAKGIMFSKNTEARNSNIVVGGAPGDGNHVYNCGQDTGGNDIVTANCDGVLISYNDCHGGNADTGIDGYADMGSTDGIVEYNWFYNHIKSTNDAEAEYGENGVDLKGSSDYIVRYNHIFGNRATGFNLNRQYSFEGAPVCKNIRAYGNYIHDNGQSNVTLKYVDHTVYFYNNLIVNSGKSHGLVGADKGVDIWIYNNTFVNNYTELGDRQRYALIIGGGNNYHVKNNIFYSDTHQKLIWNGSAVKDVVFDNNLYHSGGGETLFYWHEQFRTLREIKALGQETHGIEANPLLTDINNDDYTLLSDSPCIGSGANLGTEYEFGLAPMTDFSLVPPSIYLVNRNVYGNWDIGAFQYLGDVDPCEDVVCPTVCIDNDIWSQRCDPTTGLCVADQLLLKDATTCMNKVPTDESTIQKYLVLGGLGLAGFAMLLMSRNKK